MWKRSSGKAKASFNKTQFTILVLAIICVMAFSACASVSVSTTPLATQNLVEFTPTATITPIPPTFTPLPTIDTASVLTPTPFDPSLDGREQVVVAQAVNDLVQRANTVLNNIQFLNIEQMLWIDAFDCDDRESPFVSEAVVGYRMWFLVGELVYEYHSDESTALFCTAINALDTEPEILIMVDPVASEFLILAQRRVAEVLDISTRRVDLINLRTAQWENASLGCPVDGQTYTPTVINGYEIVLRAGGNIYTFHTSFSHIILCTTQPDDS